jgi:hypothetical protein
MGLIAPSGRIIVAPRYVRLWHKADISGASIDVHFRGQSGHGRLPALFHNLSLSESKMTCVKMMIRQAFLYLGLQC